VGREVGSPGLVLVLKRIFLKSGANPTIFEFTAATPAL
jgi:hypothetical protein